MEGKNVWELLLPGADPAKLCINGSDKCCKWKCLAGETASPFLCRELLCNVPLGKHLRLRTDVTLSCLKGERFAAWEHASAVPV